MLDYLETPDYTLSQYLFLKALAAIYFIAFASLYTQCLGLYGSKGITPIADLIKQLRIRKIPNRYYHVPTIFWYRSDDLFIKQVLLAGMGLSFLAFCNIPFTLPFLFFLLWGLYLSMHTVGASLLSFQWDILLLETGFIAMFYAISDKPNVLLQFLLCFLCFRLVFSSGCVKLLSGCHAWKTMTAMNHHYETQPIPNRIAWYAHQFNKKIQKLSCLGTFFLELPVPFLIFLPAEYRLIAFLLLLFLQMLILTSGNYAFFNWLSIALCIPLLYNPYLSSFGPVYAGPSSLLLQIPLSLIAIALIALNALQIVRLFRDLGPLNHVMAWLSPLHLVNSYGLFARMTTERKEIIIEGSNDGVHWEAYEFKWKPGDLKRAPSHIAPYQPRLDWQMWFAALGNYQQNPWFMRFLTRLMEGSEDVLDLLAHNPFPSKAPVMIRSTIYTYHFTDPKRRKEKSEWWWRSGGDSYSPRLSRKKPEKDDRPYSGSTFTQF